MFTWEFLQLAAFPGGEAGCGPGLLAEADRAVEWIGAWLRQQAGRRR